MNPKKSECGIECLDFVYDALERKVICKKCGRVVTMEEVIEGLKGAIKSAEYTDDAEACKIAILILQEQEERSKGCGICCEDKGDSTAMLGAFYITNPFHRGEYYLNTGHCKPRKIRFCPNCGRRLEEV